MKSLSPKKIIFTVSSVLILLFLMNANLSAQQLATISGTVKHLAAQVPLSDVTITAADASGNATVAVTTTDSSGNYAVSLPFPGVYSLYASRYGYINSSAPNLIELIDVSSNQVVNLYMEPLKSSLSLSTGWNFISFPQLPSDAASLEMVFNDVSQNMRIVWGYDNANKVWLKWKPSDPSPSATLSAIYHSKGYWVYMDAPATINLIEWFPPSETSVYLFEGWNLVGYQGADGQSVSKSLADINGNWGMIWWRNADEWSAKHPMIMTLPVKALTTMSKGAAYWIRAKQNVFWNGGKFVPPPQLLTGVTISEADFQKLRDKHRPLTSFNELSPPPVPDYASPESWAALWPSAGDADAAPSNTAYPEAQGTALVDVFFVHPTCYSKRDHWNGPVNDPDVKETVKFIMKYLASSFNATARVYAPRYRQFTLFSVVETETMSGMEAIELAYSDVARAFDFYMGNLNQGRPFILASHSQGSIHSGRLLQTKIVGTPIQSKLVAAYLIGMAIPNNLTGIEPARSPNDTGVYINWNSMTADADPRFFTDDIVIWVGNAYRKSKGIPILQVNPLSWLLNGHKVAASNNPGSLPYDSGSTLRPLIQGVTNADASGNFLIIERPAISSDFPDEGPDSPLLNAYYGDYHNYDYQLFYESIRKNAIDRTNAYLTR